MSLVHVDEMAADEGHWGYRAELATDLMAALGTDDVNVVDVFAAHVERWLAEQDDA